MLCLEHEWLYIYFVFRVMMGIKPSSFVPRHTM